MNSSRLIPHPNHSWLSSSALGAQRGSSILVTLVLLLLITIASLSIFTSSIIDQKATSNYVDSNYAYQEAESQLFALLDAPRSRWSGLVPKDASTPAVRIPSFSTAGSQAPASTLTMSFVESATADFSETTPGNEVGLQNITYDAISRTRFGMSRAAHKMEAIAEMPPLNNDGDPNAFNKAYNR